MHNMETETVETETVPHSEVSHKPIQGEHQNGMSSLLEPVNEASFQFNLQFGDKSFVEGMECSHIKDDDVAQHSTSRPKSRGGRHTTSQFNHSLEVNREVIANNRDAAVVQENLNSDNDADPTQSPRQFVHTVTSDATTTLEVDQGHLVLYQREPSLTADIQNQGTPQTRDLQQHLEENHQFMELDDPYGSQLPERTLPVDCSAPHPGTHLSQRPIVQFTNATDDVLHKLSSTGRRNRISKPPKRKSLSNRTNGLSATIRSSEASLMSDTFPDVMKSLQDYVQEQKYIADVNLRNQMDADHAKALLQSKLEAERTVNKQLQTKSNEDTCKLEGLSKKIANIVRFAGGLAQDLDKEKTRYSKHP